MYLRRSNKDKRDQERPRTWRAAIYLSERDSRVKANVGNELSIEVQRGLCRHQARKLQAEVVGEFVDTRLCGRSCIRRWNSPKRSDLTT